MSEDEIKAKLFDSFRAASTEEAWNDLTHKVADLLRENAKEERASTLSIYQSRIAELESALSVITEHYVNLVKTSDCGYWNPETEPEVIKARSVLTPVTEKEVA